MGWADWARHDGVALAELVRTRQVSAQQVAAQAAAAVARLNPKLEAVIELFDDVRANPDADGPDKAGKLYGVPIFLKDLGSGLKGRTQDSGSAFTKGTRIGATDPVVENFLRAGLVPLGRSTTPEFGMTFDTTTDYRGEVKVTRSPWNLRARRAARPAVRQPRWRRASCRFRCRRMAADRRASRRRSAAWSG